MRTRPRPDPCAHRATRRPRPPGLVLALVVLALGRGATAGDAPEPLEFRTPAFHLHHLSTPTGACFGDNGVLYIVETWAHRVRVMKPEGSSLRSWGNRGSAPSEFFDPEAIAFADGLLFVVDTGNHRVQVFGVDGAFRFQCGRRGTGPGELLRPSAIAVDGRRIWVADRGNHRIQVFDRQGQFLQSIGSHGAGDGHLIAPGGVAVDSSGHLYVSDSANHRIVRFAPDGGFLASWGDRGSAAGLLIDPRGLACFRDTLYVADSGNHRIQIFDLTGRPLGSWGLHTVYPHEGNGHLHYPSAIAIDPRAKCGPSGREAVVCEPFENRLQGFRNRLDPALPPPRALPGTPSPDSHFGLRCSLRGSLLGLIGEGEAVISLLDTRRETPITIHRLGYYGHKLDQLLEPTDLHLGREKRIYVCDPRARRLSIYQHEYDRNAEVKYRPQMSRFVKSLDFTAFRDRVPALESLPVLEPDIIRGNRNEELFLIDSRLGVVLVLDGELEYIRHWGSEGQKRGELRSPTDLAFSVQNDIVFVVDAGNARVQAFQLDGKFLYAWGQPGDRPGEFTRPFGIAAGIDGHVYVTDRGSHRVQKFTEQGQFVKEWARLEGTVLPDSRLDPRHLYKPAGIAQTLIEHDLIVVDHGNHRAQITTADGEEPRVFGSRLYLGPRVRPPPSGD